MKIETRPQDDRQMELVVEVEGERVQGALRAAARRISQKFNIPGFRKGKAPYEVVRRQVGDEALYDEALEDLGQAVYREALDEAKVDPFAPGSLEAVSLNPMILTFKVPLPPEVDLGDYRAVRMDYAPPQVSDEALEDAMEHLREHQALIEPADRPAQMGDVVIVDARGELVPDPEAAPDESDEARTARFLLDDKDVSLLLTPETDWPLPGVAERLVGLAAGETREFDLVIPDAYPNESLRGKTAHLVVRCAEVKSRFVPEWTDELAQSLGDYASLLDLRMKVRQELQGRADRDARDEYSRAVLEKIVEAATVEYPPVALKVEVDSLMDDLRRRLREQNLALEDYLKLSGKTEAEMRRQMEPQARERLARGLVLAKVAEVEQLRVGNAEVESRIVRVSAIFGEQAGEMRKLLSADLTRRSMEHELLSEKAMDRLVAIGRGENPPIGNAPTAQEAAEAEPSGEGEARPVAAPEGEPASQ